MSFLGKKWVALSLFVGIVSTGANASSGTALGEHTATKNLMPWPASVEWLGESMFPGETLAVSIKGGQSDRLRRALQRWQSWTGLQVGHTIAVEFVRDEVNSELTIEVASPGDPYPGIETDESYSLVVSEKKIVLRAPNTFGAMKGLQTLRQLAQACDESVCFTGVDIEDHPDMSVRGLHLDVVRHWMPAEVVKRQLDGMEAMKLNLLHWHLSDDQGFRIESLSYPALHEKGTDGNYYTQDQIREIVEYAADRGIRVMPELDLPGHSRSWQIALPWLSSRENPDYQLYTSNGLFSDPLDPTKETTYEFLDVLLQELTQLFPDPYFHMGGDEVNYDAWEDNDAIKQYMRDQGIEDFEALFARFIDRYAQIVKSLGKVPVGWE